LGQLISFYEENPVPIKGNVDLIQVPRTSGVDFRVVDGEIRSSLVYVAVPRSSRKLLVPFAQFDEWSLLDRYNEVLRVMSALGASSVTSETFVETAVRKGFRLGLGSQAMERTKNRRVESSFDYRHVGPGGPPTDPRPLEWPDEPGLAAAVTNVLENGATEVEINIRGSRTHLVDGALGVQLRELGFLLGGTSEKSIATSLRICATFPGQRKRWRPG
jgi:hypothetical protein